MATDGLRVTDLETVADRAFALFASCTGTGAAFAAQCTSYTLYSSPGLGRRLGPGGPLDLRADGWRGGAASLVLTGTRGYLLAPDGMLYAGPVDGSAPWQQVKPIPCPVGTPLADGQPTGALLAAAERDEPGPGLRVVQRPGDPAGQAASSPRPTAGSAWQNAVAAPALGLATSVAASPGGTYRPGHRPGPRRAARRAARPGSRRRWTGRSPRAGSATWA